MSCLLHYYRGVAKGEEGLCLLSFLPPILQRSSKGRNGKGRPVSSFFPASYIITEEYQREKWERKACVFFLSCLLYYYRGVVKGEMGEEGLCLLSFLPPILLQRSSKGRNGRGRPVSSFFPASYIITEE